MVFNSYNLTNINSIILNTQAVIDNQVVTKAYVDHFHQENERSRRDVRLDFYKESNDLKENIKDNDFNDKKLRNLDSISINRNPSSNKEVSNEKNVDDSIGEVTIVGFNQTLQNFLKVSVGNDTYNLAKYDKIKLIDTTIIKKCNSGRYLIPGWRVFCSDKNNN